MDPLSGTNSGERDKEIQDFSTKQVMKKNEKKTYQIMVKICCAKISFNKPKSVQSKGKQLVSDKPEGSKRRRTNVNNVYDNPEAKFSVIERADELLYSLRNEFPYFVKCMFPSNVSYSYWMIFPPRFCKMYLPPCDCTVTLVDEFGDECKTTYLFGRHGLSAGWRRFSISHYLLKGDILIFQLIGICKFKVHIVRVCQSLVMDAADGLMKMVTSGTTDPGLGEKRPRVCEC